MTSASVSDTTERGIIIAVATMVDSQLHLLIIAVLFQSSIMTRLSAENTTCRPCMADIYGPYPENATFPPSAALVKATESVPTVIVCEYLCYDQEYDYYLRIDILDPSLQFLTQRRISYRASRHEESDHNFTVFPNIVQTCNLSNNVNETIIKYRIYISSSDVPTLIAKCFVERFRYHCSNSSTLAIMPGYSIPDPDTSSSITSSKTILSPSPSPCMLSTVNHYLTETVTVTVTVNITATPQSSPTVTLSATFDRVSGNCTDMYSTYYTTLVNAILWPVAMVLIIATVFLILGIIIWLKCWRTPGGTKRNQVKDSDNSSATILSS